MRNIYVLAVALAAAASPAAAQQMQFDAHGNYGRGTQTHTDSWGAGAQVQAAWGASKAPVKVGTSAGFDYTRQDAGPSQSNLATDVTLQGGSGGSITPYAGGSIGANWSGGATKQWTGARMGLEALGGVQIKTASMGPLSWKVEERFGYVRGQEHQLMTRVGAALSF